MTGSYSSIFNYFRKLCTVCIVAVPNLHVHNGVGFPFLHIVTDTCYFLSFLIISVRWSLTMVFICGSWCLVVLNTFSWPCWPSGGLGKMSFQILCLFFNWIVGCLLCCWVMNSLYILDIKSYQRYDLQIFFPFGRLPFHFADCFLCWVEAFSFDGCLFLLCLFGFFECQFLLYLCFTDIYRYPLHIACSLMFAKQVLNLDKVRFIIFKEVYLRTLA